MNTPRTALEELLLDCRLIAEVTDAETFDRLNSDFERKCSRYIQEHGKALSEALGGWLPIENFGTSAECVLLYNPALDKDEEFPGHPFMVSNRVYAKLHAKQNGYTHWKPITPPTSAKGDQP